MERHLPILLERALPQLALPPDRMAQVRRRVQRRRRMTVGGAALTVGCAVVATGLWPEAFGLRAVP